MQPAASLSPAAKAKAEALARAAEAHGARRRESEAANLRRFGENVRDLRAHGQVTDHGAVMTAADGSPALLIKFRDAGSAEAARDAIFGAWPE